MAERNSVEQVGREWAYSRWTRADRQRREQPFSLPGGNNSRAQLTLDALREAVLWASDHGLLASDIAAMQEAAKTRWDELREGGGLGMPEGRGRCEVVGGRARRYLKKV